MLAASVKGKGNHLLHDVPEFWLSVSSFFFLLQTFCITHYQNDRKVDFHFPCSFSSCCVQTDFNLSVRENEYRVDGTGNNLGMNYSRVAGCDLQNEPLDLMQIRMALSMSVT